MSSGGITGILLAGGQSRRFGSDKLLHPLPDGTPIAVVAARELLANNSAAISQVPCDDASILADIDQWQEIPSQANTLRISFLADYPQFAEVLAPEIFEHWRYVLTDETIKGRVAKLRQHLNKSELPIALIAHTDTEVLGTASLRANDLEGYAHLSPWLGGVFVRQPYRGRGIASALSQAVEQHAWSLGHNTLYLFTPNQQRLYARLGWSQFESTIWHGVKADVMTKARG